MILLSLILTVFALSDNCTDSICNAAIKLNGVVKYENRHTDKAELLSWIEERSSRKSWGRPEEIKDVCPTGFIHTDDEGNPIPIDDRTEISKVVVNIEYDTFDEQGNPTGVADHDCDRYTFPADYTIELTNAQAEKDALDYAEVGSNVSALCDKIYSMILGYNISRSFDTPTLNQMKNDFKTAHDYVKKDCQPIAAKAAIEAIAADPAKFTQEFKDLVLNEFTKAGF